MAEKNEFLRRNQAELQKEMASLKSSTALILDQMDDSKLLKLQKDLRDLKSQVNKQPVIIQPDLSLPVQDGPDHEIVLRLMQKEINNLKSRTEDLESNPVVQEIQANAPEPKKARDPAGEAFSVESKAY